LLTLAFGGLGDGLGEDVTDACRVLAEDMGVDTQGYSGVGMAEVGGNYVDRDACQRSVVACRWRRS
jgi:hypothetical protein